MIYYYSYSSDMSIKINFKNTDNFSLSAKLEMPNENLRSMLYLHIALHVIRILQP